MKIPVKKYRMDESLSWEERYKQLEAHHLEETSCLIQEIKRLETENSVQRGLLQSASGQTTILDLSALDINTE